MQRYAAGARSHRYDENLMHRENKISLTQQFKLCEKRCKSASDIV